MKIKHFAGIFVITSILFTTGCSLFQPASVTLENGSEYTISCIFTTVGEQEYTITPGDEVFVLLLPGTLTIKIIVPETGATYLFHSQLSYLDAKVFRFVIDEGE